MAQIKGFKKMTLDEAITKTRTLEEEQAYLELHNVWMNQRD